MARKPVVIEGILAVDYIESWYPYLVLEQAEITSEGHPPSWVIGQRRRREMDEVIMSAVVGAEVHSVAGAYAHNLAQKIMGARVRITVERLEEATDVQDSKAE